jgi:hypothetical protein
MTSDKPDKKKNIPDDLVKALEGFEDILDLIDESTLGKRKNAKDGNDSLGLYHFLESELTRLKSLDQFFSNLDTYLEGTQSQSVRKKLRGSLALEKENLAARLCQENSPFLQYMETLWNAVYKNADGNPKP